MNDMVDHVMEVMEAAFDPAFGEAWNRRQVSDALLTRNCRCIVLDGDCKPPEGSEKAAGFLLSRQAADEEEILLIAVRPEYRRQGIASALLSSLIASARSRDVTRLFLEMREGNPAEALYLKHRFISVGRRQNYYNRGALGALDAISFALNV